MARNKFNVHTYGVCASAGGVCVLTNKEIRYANDARVSKFHKRLHESGVCLHANAGIRQENLLFRYARLNLMAIFSVYFH